MATGISGDDVEEDSGMGIQISQNEVFTQAPPAQSLSDSVYNPWLGGKAGEGVVTELHGKWYTQAYRGNVFHGSTLVAGTIIPISTSTAATFVLYNPLGSGVNLELISYTLGVTVATVIVSPIGMGFSAGVGGAVVAPTGVTALTPRNGLLGFGNATKVNLYSTATLTATTTYFKTMLNFTSTNATAGNGLGPSAYKYDFDGTLILPPGTLVQTCGLVAPSTSASVQEFVWAEVPV